MSEAYPFKRLKWYLPISDLRKTGSYEKIIEALVEHRCSFAVVHGRLYMSDAAKDLLSEGSNG